MSSEGDAEITTINVCVPPSQEWNPPSLGAPCKVEWKAGPHFLLNGFFGEVSLLNQNQDLTQQGDIFSGH